MSTIYVVVKASNKFVEKSAEFNKIKIKIIVIRKKKISKSMNVNPPLGVRYRGDMIVTLSRVVQSNFKIPNGERVTIPLFSHGFSKKKNEI